MVANNSIWSFFFFFFFLMQAAPLKKKNDNRTNDFSPKRVSCNIECQAKDAEVSVDFFYSPLWMLSIEVTN